MKNIHIQPDCGQGVKIFIPYGMDISELDRMIATLSAISNANKMGLRSDRLVSYGEYLCQPDVTYTERLTVLAYINPYTQWGESNVYQLSTIHTFKVGQHITPGINYRHLIKEWDVPAAINKEDK